MLAPPLDQTPSPSYYPNSIAQFANLPILSHSKPQGALPHPTCEITILTNSPPLSNPTLSLMTICPRHLHTDLLTQCILSHLTDHFQVLHSSQSHFTTPPSTNPHQFNHNYSVRISHFKTFKSQQPITHTQITVKYPHYLPSYIHTIQLTKSNILTHPSFGPAKTI
jgi:hypothetical protein